LTRTVLLADDSVTAQNMGRRILTDAGYEVVTVNNGSAALKKIRESRPDLIVLDVYMPGYGGLEVCERLKQSGETMRIPVLLTVGKMEPFKGDDAKRVRADGYIVKPFDATELLAALTRLEERIVPQSDRAPGWHGEDPGESRNWLWRAENSASPARQSNWSDKIAYLAEAKNREGQSAATESACEEHPEAPPASQASTPPGEVPAAEARWEAEALKDIEGSAETPQLPLEHTSEPGNSHLPSAWGGEEAGEGRSEPSSVESSEQGGEAAGRPEPLPATSLLGIATVEGPSRVPAPVPASNPASRWVAEKVELTPEEASLALDKEMRRQQASSQVSNKAETSADYAAKPSETPELESDGPSGATFAAAAAASAGEVPSPVAVSEDQPQTEAKAPAEKAAAWENWQHIRDSVMSAKCEDRAKNAPPTTLASSSEGAERTPAPGLEIAALASIVDSVLAELKPKLMEEIAKKFAAEKK
jgi:CheY-like chemotaxis protein